MILLALLNVASLIIIAYCAHLGKSDAAIVMIGGNLLVSLWMIYALHNLMEANKILTAACDNALEAIKRADKTFTDAQDSLDNLNKLDDADLYFKTKTKKEDMN